MNTNEWQKWAEGSNKARVRARLEKQKFRTEDHSYLVLKNQISTEYRSTTLSSH